MRTRTFAAVGLFLVMPVWAFSAVPTTYVPGGPIRGLLTREEAVRLALEYDPAVAQARAFKSFSLGLLQEQKGIFDEQVLLKASFERETLPVPTGVQNNEFGRRRVLRAVALTFQALADGIQQQLNSGIFGPLPECVETTLIIGTTVTEIHCIPPSVFIDLEAILRGSEDAELDEAVQAVQEAWRRQLEVYLATSRFVAFVGRQLLRQQGVAPTIEDRDTFSYNLGLSKVFRNGILLEPKVEFAAVRDTWRGKPLDPSFGGKGVLVSYRSQFGFHLDVPLGRGGGVVSAQAAERSASKQAEAAAYQEAAALQSAALRASLAYFNAAAAKKRVALLEATVRREQELQEIAKALVEAEELAPAEGVLLVARLAQAEANLAQARSAYRQAQKELLTQIGVSAMAMEEFPEVVETLPPPPNQEELAILEKLLQEEPRGKGRPEVTAARLVREASGELAKGARVDLRRDVRLVFTAWYSGLHESNKTMAVSRFWPDASKAFGRGFTGPSAAVALQFNLPFANSFARGRLQSSLALERQAEVRHQDTVRTIGLRSREAWWKLRQRQQELQARQLAEDAARQSLEAAKELFQAGELSMVDLVLTEEALVSAQLAVVDAQLQVVVAKTQLDFELGRLLPVQVTGLRVAIAGE